MVGSPEITRLNNCHATHDDVMGLQTVEFSANLRYVFERWWSWNRFTAAAMICFISHSLASSNVLKRYTPLGNGSFNPIAWNCATNQSKVCSGVRRRIFPTTLPGY